MAQPEDFPRAADDSFVIQSWAEAGTAVEPSAGRKATGWVAGDVVSEGELNWLSQEPMRTIRAVNSRAVTTWRLFGSWVSLNGRWDNGPNPLEGYLSDGAAASRVADVYVDTGSGAVLMQVTVPLASPYLFSASRTHWIAVPYSSIAPPKVTLAELSIQIVALGFPDPGAPAGFVTIWRVDTDGTTITSESRVVPEFPALREIGVVGDLHVAGTSDLDGLVTLGAGMDANNQDIFDANEITAAGPVTITGAIASGTIGTTGNVSIGGNLDMTAGSISNVTTLGTTGDISCGGNLDMTSGSISNVTTLTTSGDVSIGGNLDMTTGSISNVTTIGSNGLASLGSLSTASAIITSLDCGLSEFLGTVNASVAVVRMLEADFTATTLTVDAGEVRWDGTKLAVGDGTSAKPLVFFYEVFAAGPVGPVGAIAGSIVTGSSIAVALTIGDIVWVEGGFETTNSLNTTPSAGLEVNDGGGTTILHATTRKIVAGDYADVNLRYRYTAVSTATHTFRMTHGAATGNTTTRNIGVTVRRTL